MCAIWPNCVEFAQQTKRTPHTHTNANSTGLGAVFQPTYPTAACRSTDCYVCCLVNVFLSSSALSLDAQHSNVSMDSSSLLLQAYPSLMSLHVGGWPCGRISKRTEKTTLPRRHAQLKDNSCSTTPGSPLLHAQGRLLEAASVYRPPLKELHIETS